LAQLEDLIEEVEAAGIYNWNILRPAEKRMIRAKGWVWIEKASRQTAVNPAIREGILLLLATAR
jgi:hypothetical protein